MTFSDFESTVARLREEKPTWFGLEPDSPATPDQIEAAEQVLGVRFPDEYARFLSRFGGGYFAFGNVFSVDGGSDWNVVTRNGKAGLLGHGFLAVSENGAGDYYGYRIEDGRTLPGIWFWDHETSQVSQLYESLLLFLTGVALKRQ